MNNFFFQFLLTSRLTSSMRAGWIRPSAISRSNDTRATSRPERIESRKNHSFRCIIDNNIDAGAASNAGYCVLRDRWCGLHFRSVPTFSTLTVVSMWKSTAEPLNWLNNRFLGFSLGCIFVVSRISLSVVLLQIWQFQSDFDTNISLHLPRLTPAIFSNRRFSSSTKPINLFSRSISRFFADPNLFSRGLKGLIPFCGQKVKLFFQILLANCSLLFIRLQFRPLWIEHPIQLFFLLIPFIFDFEKFFRASAVLLPSCFLQYFLRRVLERPMILFWPLRAFNDQPMKNDPPPIKAPIIKNIRFHVIPQFKTTSWKNKNRTHLPQSMYWKNLSLTQWGPA